MILYRWQGRARNFGDELNAVLWPKLLPGFFDDDPSARFLGIGSVLDSRHDPHVIKIVAGAGYGGYEPPAGLDATWHIHWVRGPRSARQLGIDPGFGLGDPASLLPMTGVAAGVSNGSIGFMPHFESIARGAWQQAAAVAGLTLIDPRGDPLAIIEAIRGCRVLLSEALHGVIVADALRVPWVPLMPVARVHRAKWHDWAESLGLDLRFQPLPASSMPERMHASRLASLHAGRHLLNQHADWLRPAAAEWLIARAARALHAAAAAPPSLSADRALSRAQDRMMERAVALRRAACRTYLRPCGVSAYEIGLIG